MFIFYCYFFFSSRRRHTRYWRDWSSDVCSSDLERTRVAPLPLDVGYRAAREAQRDEGVVQAVVLASEHAPGVDPLDLAQGPAPAVEVGDHPVEEDSPAESPVGVPVVPPQQERRAAARAPHADRPEVPGVHHLLDPDVLGEEADDVPDEEPSPTPRERLDDRLGVLEVARQRFLDDDVQSVPGGREREVPVVGGREADVHQLDVLRDEEFLVGGVRSRPDAGGSRRRDLGPGVNDADDLRLGHVGVGAQVYSADKAGADDADPHPRPVATATNVSLLSRPSSDTNPEESNQPPSPFPPARAASN